MTVTYFKLSTTNQEFELKLNISQLETLSPFRNTASRAVHNLLTASISDYCEKLLEERQLISTTDWFKNNAKKFVEPDGRHSLMPIIDVSSGSETQASHEVRTILENNGWNLLASTLLINPPRFLGLHLLIRRQNWKSLSWKLISYKTKKLPRTYLSSWNKTLFIK